jgi:RNase adapter protein RapZ
MTSGLQHIVIITGYSGAGKSTVLRALEDLGFFCVDNLPIGLVIPFFQFTLQSHLYGQKLALGIDIRAGHAIDELASQLLGLHKEHSFAIKVIFLTASCQTLLKRFQETRRRHPLIDPLDLPDAIEQERRLLEPLKHIADIVVETDQFTIHDLRLLVRNFFADSKLRMIVSLISFGFKYGVPQESNFVYDLRSLPNPYFVPGLKDYDGTHLLVRDYLFAQPHVQEYWQRLSEFCSYAIEKSYTEGRFFIHIALGCTGGRHRSVAFVQELVKLPIDYVQFLVKHRDITRDVQQ